MKSVHGGRNGPGRSEAGALLPGEHRDTMTLYRAQGLIDGVHPAAERMRREVDRGRMLRVRRGIYLPTSAWLGAPPWVRFRISAAGVAAQSPGVVFCRETALALAGIPLLRVPDRVHIRADYDNRLGLARPGSMTGRATYARQQYVCDEWAASNHQQRPDARAVLSGHPLSRHRLRAGFRRLLDCPGAEDPSVASVWSAQQMSKESQELALADICVCDGGLGSSQPGDRCESVRLQLELLSTTLADTVPMMRFLDAVIVLDAVMAQLSGKNGTTVSVRHVDMGLLEELVRAGHSARAQARWRRAREFADGASESAGESYSRVLIHEYGFVAPELQIRFEGGPGGGIGIRGLPGPSREIRVDFYWEGAGVVGEFDGRVKYGRDGVSIASAEHRRYDVEGLRIGTPHMSSRVERRDAGREPDEVRPWGASAATGSSAAAARNSTTGATVGIGDIVWAEKLREDRL